MVLSSSASVHINGRSYLPPTHPTVVICMDGSDPAYTNAAMAAGAMPYLAETLPSGFDATAQCVIPSFTNPNNMSIMTGVPPAVHGICGNYFLDDESGQAVMMNDPCYLRAGTIFSALSRQGVPLAIITSKDKLRRLLGWGMEGGICFSAEKVQEVTMAENGISRVLERMGETPPSIYSADVTRLTLQAGVALLEGRFPEVTLPQLMYLSTTDYIQHKHAPGSREANDFYHMLDCVLGSFHRLSATWVLTADHGMSAKSAPDGSPQVIYLQTLLDELFGPGRTQVILPITDPYVVHHGALGSYACLYLIPDTHQKFPDTHQVARCIEEISRVSGISWVGTRKEAAELYSLPADRLGDIIVISDAATAIGTRCEDHDLSGLEVPLRSHGGLGERLVPLMSNRAISGEGKVRSWHNYDAFDLALNLCRRT
jgi:phosphonoacetate hydrolase